MSTVVKPALRPHAFNEFSERPVVVAAWHERARRLGLHEEISPDFGALPRAELARLTDQHHPLCAHAIPIMEMLYEQVRDTHSMVILTDATGLILHALGDTDFRVQAERVALRPGVNWSEDSKGTNAIGTAITDGRPTVVHGSEHFLTANRFLTCSCSPIRDPHGRVIGALDVSASKELYHAHTLALVRITTQMIENHLFVDQFSESVRLHFHTRPEFLGTLEEGIAAFDEGGRFIAANRAAQLQLGLTPEMLLSHTLSSLFGITVSALMDHARTGPPGRLTVRLRSGVKVTARAELHAPAMRLRRSGGSSIQDEPSATASAPSSGVYTLTLDDLDTGEPAMAHLIERVRKVQRRGIPIVILGETGTGKEVLARAIHADSGRGSKPFVAVDCASIPESLIEAELFGYEEGAFTGARRRGSPGKILAANGGTLFLDEIGEMPLGMQTRLLRVLQERAVTPLGSNRAVALDVAVISATHRDLLEMIRRGEFRQDLYYRLNGLIVRLPPLRERCDLESLIKHIFERECAVPTIPAISSEVSALFRRYHWPGNLRQLANALRTAAVMAADDGDGNTIHPRHLPDDFLEEVNRSRSRAASSRAAEGTPDIAPSSTAEASRPALPDFSAADSIAADPGTGVLKDMRALAIRSALERHAGNISAAARSLGISRNTVYRALREPY